MPDLRLPDVNDIRLSGRLTRDPELKFLSNGTALCNFSVAWSKKYTRDGVEREDKLFINASVWGKSAEYVSEHMRKGDPVLVDGALRIEEWEDRAGVKRTTAKIHANRVQALSWRESSITPRRRGTATPSQRTHEDEGIPF